jgi:polysaccharide pyruvyl transferase WcaK-like protein
VKVLILNSDSPHNRGDRAILAGLIALIKDIEPSAQITALSQFEARDSDWFGIRFLPFSPYSTSPVHYLRLLAEAKRSDVVLWGGGELLKDYTNRLSLYYWFLKTWGIRFVNKNLIGAFQGIGPTSAPSSKKLIAACASNCKEFLVRDARSKDLLMQWGAKTKITASFDPAVYVSRESEIPGAVIGLGLRRWFHYQQGGLLPTKYRFWQKAAQVSIEETNYRKSIVSLAQQLLDDSSGVLRFFPMHMAGSENDAGFAKEIIAELSDPSRCEVVEKDDLSPDQYLTLIAQCEVFVASRLHSAILASVAKVPALCLYYVDKGRLFFEQLSLSEYAVDIRFTQEPGSADALFSKISSLRADPTVATRRDAALEQMRAQLRDDLKKALTL